LRLRFSSAITCVLSALSPSTFRFEAGLLWTFIRHCSTLSAHRLAQEVQRAQYFNDLPVWRTRFASVDCLAIDDVDDLFGQPAASEFLLQVLQLRAKARRRTLLSATLSHLPSVDCALTLFLNPQPAIWLI